MPIELLFLFVEITQQKNSATQAFAWIADYLEKSWNYLNPNAFKSSSTVLMVPMPKF